MADGESYNDALKNLQVIIHEWIETAKKLAEKFLYLKVENCTTLKYK